MTRDIYCASLLLRKYLKRCRSARMSINKLAQIRYEQFSRFADDLYPGRYTKEFCKILAEQELEINVLRKTRQTTIVAHNYLYPEFHEIADIVGDSLGLSLYVQSQRAFRVDFESVFFMGATAKIICGNNTRIFVSDYPDVLGCSLVFGTDHAWLERWKKKNPDGILVTYINSDAYTKSISDFVSTSRNTDKIIAHALKNFPGRKILVLPDKFLGRVMKVRALELLKRDERTVDSDLVDIYEHSFAGLSACCYVHEKIGEDAINEAIDRYPDADIMIHPECGCSSVCLWKVQRGEIPNTKAYFLSTEGMVEHARHSKVNQFIVATEKGMIYRLRSELPEKTFIPVSSDAVCKYMKENTLEKLIGSLKHDRVEIILCNDCCNPKKPFQDEKVVHIQRSVATKAKSVVERSLVIQ